MNVNGRVVATLKTASSLLLLVFSTSVFGADTPASGTFTDEQFERGQALYNQQCAQCHGAELDSAAAPALIGPTFRKTWALLGANVAELYIRISSTMPPRQGGDLQESEYLELLAYVLGRNNVLPGSEALRNDYPYLSAIPFARGDGVLDIAANFIEGANGLAPTGSGPSFTELMAAADNSEDWLYHNQNYQGTRYSALDEINISNADALQQVCVYELPTNATMQTGPIIYQGTMYVTNATHTAAIDAASCELIWSFDWAPRDRMVWSNNRGVAIKDGYVVRGTADGYLLALDSANGNLLWARQIADPWLGETFTMPPMIFEDTVLIGPAGSENAISGWLGAFSLLNGDLIWKFMTVPEAAAGGGATWGNPNNILLGGGAVWTPLSMDLALGEVYAAVTNPAPDLPAYLRPGENLYSNNIVALDVRSGELKWHKSIVPNDDHDWDLTQVSPVLKAGINNVSRDMIATVGKDGILRTLDKNSRAILYETPVTTILNAEVPVTQEGVFACPGVYGGVLWSGPSYYPAQKLLITPSIDYCAQFTASEEISFTPGRMYMGGRVRPAEEQTGWLTAIDVEIGEVSWRYHSLRPMVAGVTTTAGGLVMTGELSGNLLILNANSGEVLNSIPTGAPVGGGIVTYEVDGKQFIATSSGNAMMTFRTGDEVESGGRVVVYSLPAR